ncbi:P-loop containing nucleoside triphosphate hydrolase protein [Pestalotiopsis sp. NC0098]|nr:P-loop containing nucleoside triphosphate hydrolase protein [Pestalotiopsis sp. NC0098]
MGAPTNILADLTAHMDGRKSLSITSFETLKHRHPNFVVSQVDKTSLDFLGYAKAGNAEATPDAESDYITNLSFSREASSTDRTLKDKVLFAKYKYSWDDTDFFLFVLSPRDFREHDELHFLLTPRGTAVYHDGVHPKAKELAKAVGQWTAQTSKKTLDFNSKPWEHHNYLEAADWAWETMPSIPWDDIIMDATAKTAMKEEATTFFTSRDLFKNFNLTWKRGIIFHGPSGTGKTAIIKALMATLAEGQYLVPSVYANFTSQHDVYPSRINDMFSRARQTAPCLLVLENLDSLMSEDHRGTFLEELDNGNNDGILILGSVRNIQELDPAIRDRPGRFDTKYYCKLPGHDERVAFAKQWKAKLDKYNPVTLPEEACEFIAKLTDGFSYTHLKELFSTLLFFHQNAPTEGEASNSETPSVEESASNQLSARQKALADIATPDSLHNNRVITSIRRQASVMLNEMEISETASKQSRRYGSDRLVGRREVSRDFAADDNDASEATSSRSYSHIDVPVVTPSRSSMMIMDLDEDACPGCTRHLRVPVRTANDPDACPGCTRRAANLGAAQAPISPDACPGCTRKAKAAAVQDASEDACPGCTKKLAVANDISEDACPGCTRKEKAAAAQIASEDACPGCTKELAVADDVSEDACPGCTRKLTSTASANDGVADVSPDACPGCTRKRQQIQPKQPSPARTMVMLVQKPARGVHAKWPTPPTPRGQ